jgi:hypothetical protein
MREWEVKQGRHVRGFSEQNLRELLRAGELTGAESARHQGGAWAPLYETSLFVAALPGVSSPRALLLRRTGGAVLAHLALMLIGSLLVGLPLLTLVWMVIWAAHAAREAPLIRSAWRAPWVASLTRPKATLRPPGLREAAVELHQEAGAAELVAAVEELLAAGGALGDRIRALSRLASPTEIAGLEAQRDLVEGRLDSTRDARNRQVLSMELEAIVRRLGSLREAAAEVERLRGEERTLQHQMEALRVELVQRSDVREAIGELRARVDDLRAKAIAHAEVDAALKRSAR